MAFDDKEIKRFLDDHKIGARQDDQDNTDEAKSREAQRLYELFERWLSEAWGRELCHRIIANADVLKMTPFSTDSHTTAYNVGLQAIAKRNLHYIKEFHFDEYMKMEQEAHNRKHKKEMK